MTDLTTEPVAPATAPPSPETALPVPAVHSAPEELPHTPGGWPVVPLALSASNTTVGLLATTALAGGPAALAASAGGTAALGLAAAYTRSRRQTNGRKTTARNNAGRSRQARGGLLRRRGSASVPSQSRSTGTGNRKTKGKSTGGGGSASSAGRSRGAKQPSTAPRMAGAARRAPGAAKSALRSGAGTASRGARQVKALRAQQRAAAPRRAQQRAQTTAARRGLADARKASAAARRTDRAAGKGPLGKSRTAAVNKAAQARGALTDKSRAARDRRASGKVAGHRSAIRKAPARRLARRALRRSAARFHSRRLLAGLLAAVIGVVGLVSTPLGRRMRCQWMQYPGRRLYRRLVNGAADERSQRDAAIREELEQAETAADAAAEQGAEEIAAQVQRPTQAFPTITLAKEAGHVNGFNFEDAAAEMESAATSYEPDGCMEILAMVEKLPEALTCVANTLRILAERADGEFPLEKEVAGGFNEVFTALMTAVSAAEDLGPIFRQAHEQDIARHEDPRNGPEAEKGWNV
ncbi:hypothetical protein [Streptomyces sp. ICBB 8177]|uniref:hypothetical protein n=1 Tax=Streptomyces sp. ICBB 8177 TaxID=563922 RepID=UPI000D677EC7|nr:hypothetical protein [Streptomyces sp. ICBB 8177]PWI43190.1 hypothetical protein CK485_13485 [Streptomyces sp. ICBB 8177]